MDTLRSELLSFLEGGQAHMDLDQVLEDFPEEQINTKPSGLPYSFWHLLEHMRIVQWDLLRFIVDPNHVSPDYPEGYWPRPDQKADWSQWQQSVTGFKSDLKEILEIVRDQERDLLAELPHAPGYILLRELFLVGDHNSYHIGEFAILRRTTGFKSPHE